MEEVGCWPIVCDSRWTSTKVSGEGVEGAWEEVMLDKYDLPALTESAVVYFEARMFGSSWSPRREAQSGRSRYREHSIRQAGASCWCLCLPWLRQS